MAASHFKFGKERSRRTTRSTALVLGMVFAAFVLVGALAVWRADRAGQAGEAQLAQAEKDLLAQRVEPGRQDLLAANEAFRRMHADLHGSLFGADLALWRVVPLVRVQVRAVDTFASIGMSLSRAGLPITDAAATIQRPSGQVVPLSASLDKLRAAQASLESGIRALDKATAQVYRLNHFRLLGPIEPAHREAARRLTRIDTSAKSADDALSALITFIGGDGPRRYLILSQNPNELRPTGGFIGSYGVLTAAAGHVSIERYDDSINWVEAHPEASIPAAQLGSPFRFYDPPLDQNLTNVNGVPDWPPVAQLALTLWHNGGEAPADGVVSFTPQFLSRVLAVTGPVNVPSYNETVSSSTVAARIEYYTHQATPPPGTNRKDFLGPLGQAVVAKLLDAPPSQWLGLGTAVGQAFAARQLLVWSRDGAVESTLIKRKWDGALPASAGDFFYDSEFEYGAKNGGGLKRTFDSQVAINADGSARVTTTITIQNTEGPSPVNDNVLTYYTLYGPTGAALDETASDPPFSHEAAIAGHPAAGWFRTITPDSTGSIKVVWDVPQLAQQLSDGSWQYAIEWPHIVDNPGDVLNLTVVLPKKTHWVGRAPPPRTILDHDVICTFVYRTSG